MTTEGIGYNPLNLAVDRAEFLRSPALDFFHSGRIETQKETFCRLFGHVIDRECRS